MARKTRERILEVSLAMFNASGEPNVTTNHIADELEISPGNLYYHFRNKDDIVEHLFERYEARMDQALATPEDRLPDLEDVWLQLHLAFEVMGEYRFIYRDLVDLTSRNRKLRMHFARILRRAQESAVGVLKGLAAAGILDAGHEEIEATATNVLLVTTFWMSYSAVRSGGFEPAGDDPTEGIRQVMQLIAPYLREPERRHLDRLARAYARP